MGSQPHNCTIDPTNNSRTLVKRDTFACKKGQYYMLKAPLLSIQDRHTCKADDTGQCVMITVHCPKGLIRIPVCTCIMKCLVSVLWFGLSKGSPNQGRMNSNLDHYRLSKFKIK